MTGDDRFVPWMAADGPLAYTPEHRDRAGERAQIWRTYVKTQAKVLADSTVSFNSIHDRTKRTETSHIRDGSWLTDELAKDNGLDITADELTKA